MPQQLSPINIETKKAISDARLKTLDIHYNESKPTTIQNTGKLVRINFKGGYISGGFLPNEYVLSTIHIYWGKEDDYGSNHLIDVYKYSGEINLVHWNKKNIVLMKRQKNTMMELSLLLYSYKYQIIKMYIFKR